MNPRNAVQHVWVQVESAHLLLGGFLLICLLLGILFQVGFIGWAIRAIMRPILWSIDAGFRTWRRLFAWIPWPLLLVLVLAAHFGALTGGPWLELFGGLLLSFAGVVACLAYMYLDAERAAVGKGYKALHSPLKGQELAADLVRYGPRAGIPLLAVATIAIVLGFTLLNEGLYETIGQTWYRQGVSGPRTSGKAVVQEVGDAPEYLDFLAYTLINLVRVVDLLDVANAYNVTHLTYVHQAKWPSSTLLMLFRSFFTLVLLQQITSSIRQGNLLGQSIRDFWSPHAPVSERARLVLAQHGTAIIRPLLRSVTELEYLTPEHREDLPSLLAEVGPAGAPLLARYLEHPNENARVVAVAALGRLHALGLLSQLARRAQDPSDLVRQSLADTLGVITAPGPQLLAKRWQLYQSARPTWVRSAWLQKAMSWWAPAHPVERVVALLRQLLADSSPIVRHRAAAALGQLGAAATAAASELIALLQDADESVRCQAATALGQISGETELINRALAAALHDASVLVKAAAARALGQRKQEAAPVVHALLPLLRDSDTGVRDAAAAAVAQIGTLTPRASHELNAGLASEDTAVRAQAAEVIGTIGLPSAATLASLIQALSDQNDQVRANAAEAIGRVGASGSEAMPALIKALGDQDNQVCSLAAWALGQMGTVGQQAIPALHQALQHVNPEVRARAAEAIGKVGGTETTAIDALKQAANDPDGAVRSQAIVALARNSDLDLACGVLLEATEDPDPRVRAAALEALAPHAMTRASVCAALLRIADDTSDEVKVQGATVLGDTGVAAPAVLEVLTRLLNNDTVAVQVSAARALGKLGPTAADAVEHLTRAMLTGEVMLRRQVLWALAQIDPAGAVAMFAAGLNDEDAEVRKLASAGLLKVPQLPEDVVTSLVSALRDPEVQIRSNAALALSRLDVVPAEAVPVLIENTRNPDDGLRLNATRALIRAPEQAVNGTFVALLEDPNPRVRLTAARHLLTLKPDHAKARALVAEADEATTPAPTVASGSATEKLTSVAQT